VASFWKQRSTKSRSNWHEPSFLRGNTPRVGRRSASCFLGRRRLGAQQALAQTIARAFTQLDTLVVNAGVPDIAPPTTGTRRRLTDRSR
jgi:hypothetical protein